MTDMVPVNSANLKAVGYDAETKSLFVEFVNGGTAVFSNVPENVKEQITSAESPGRTFNQLVRDRYAHKYE